MNKEESDDNDEQRTIIKLLNERLDEHNENRKAVQEEVHRICNEIRMKLNEMEEKINNELERQFTKEDDRLQSTLSELNTIINTKDEHTNTEVFRKAKAELAVKQTYEIKKHEPGKNIDFSSLYKLITEKKILEELVELKQPEKIKIDNVNAGTVSFWFTGSACEEKILAENGFDNIITHKVLLWKRGDNNEDKDCDEYNLKKFGSYSFSFTPDIMEANTVYCMKVKSICKSRSSEWSDTVEFSSSGFSECSAWKECPSNVCCDRRYTVNEKNPRIATKSGALLCTIVGNSPVPLNTITMWRIKIIETVKNDGYGIEIGVAPFDIDLNENYNYLKCGWYFDCYSSVLWSGPPHNYDCGDKEYGPRKEDGEYIRSGDTIGVIMDSSKGELSFVVNGMDLGVAYSGIPLNKPLVPCVILYYWGDSVELMI